MLKVVGSKRWLRTTQESVWWRGNGVGDSCLVFALLCNIRGTIWGFSAFLIGGTWSKIRKFSLMWHLALTSESPQWQLSLSTKGYFALVFAHLPCAGSSPCDEPYMGYSSQDPKLPPAVNTCSCRRYWSSHEKVQVCETVGVIWRLMCLL